MSEGMFIIFVFSKESTTYYEVKQTQENLFFVILDRKHVQLIQILESCFSFYLCLSNVCIRHFVHYFA